MKLYFYGMMSVLNYQIKWPRWSRYARFLAGQVTALFIILFTILWFLNLLLHIWVY